MENQKQKIAVIGTGAAGFGVLTGLLNKQADFEIDVLDIGRDVSIRHPYNNVTQAGIRKYYDQVYQNIRKKNPLKFPPPKTHLSDPIPRQAVGNSLNIMKSESFGGLTNYWGSTMLPFTDREMKNWPISYSDLKPYYQKIADLVGVAGRSDGLSKYFSDDFINRPAITPAYMAYKLDSNVNHKGFGGYRFYSGLNRCAVETREGESSKCVACGECLAGCFKDSIFSTRMIVGKYLQDKRVKYIQGKVKKIISGNGQSVIELESGEKHAGYDKVFLAAGCPHTTEIVMRSLNIEDKLIMRDNAVYVFPILYFGRRPKEAKNKKYLSLCNLITVIVPDSDNEPMLQIQTYPNFDYMWRYNMPKFIWSLIRPFMNYSRSRVFFARVYDHSDYSQSYSLRLVNDELVMGRERKAAAGQRIKNVMKAIKEAVNHSGFYIPPIKPILQKVNTHYAGTLPFGGGGSRDKKTGEVMENVFVCDSSYFPDSPAINPGFTSMANAFRIVDEVIK